MPGSDVVIGWVDDGGRSHFDVSPVTCSHGIFNTRLQCTCMHTLYMCTVYMMIHLIV